jgi:hypothetical protein
MPILVWSIGTPQTVPIDLWGYMETPPRSWPTTIHARKAGISTSYVERQNLTMRMQMRKFTRLTNGASKKLDNQKASDRTLAFGRSNLRYPGLTCALISSQATRSGWPTSWFASASDFGTNFCGRPIFRGIQSQLLGDLIHLNLLHESALRGAAATHFRPYSQSASELRYLIGSQLMVASASLILGRAPA